MNLEARKAVFQAYLRNMNVVEINLEQVAEGAEYFTPADIEAVCASAGQAAFEKEIYLGKDYKIQTEDLLQAVKSHRATITPEDMARFQEDVVRYCRADYCRLMIK